MSRQSRTLTLKNKLGLHARAATALVKLSQQFDATIILEAKGREANADSVLGLLLLEGHQGQPVTLHCEGPDAVLALDAVAALIDAGFDEDQ
ncbi:HPr family phosphocarrier protein [Gallaecimonas kandeliae]|uniref:HPr family phosphocarrier protein n=1 Tax=Gallaecimonas kandeliae TaxID=3029055 RepID=UPI0026483CE4|nr:HPr family phosphocarrier protein [Gallaecimonas kandeliae]WKE66045.1 HPr family phosphocarrier protein [Gallaecimonas kandeliae]